MNKKKAASLSQGKLEKRSATVMRHFLQIFLVNLCLMLSTLIIDIEEIEITAYLETLINFIKQQKTLLNIHI